MSEYLEAQQNGSPVKVRIHRRVLAGLEREGASEFRGFVMGSASPSSGEVVVEDFAVVAPGEEEEFARRDSHSLPSVGYFRAGTGDDTDITTSDWELFARYFPEAQDVLLIFQLVSGAARLGPVFVKSGGALHQIEPAGAATPSSYPALPELPPHRSAFRRREPVTRTIQPAKRFLWPTLAVLAGLLIGIAGAAYFGTQRRVSRQPAVGSTTATVKQQPPAPAPPAERAPTAPTAGADRSLEISKPEGQQSRADFQREIRTVLTRWSSSLLADDLDAYAGLYASSVSPYFTKNRASRSQIRDEVGRTHSRYGKMTVYRITDVTIASLDAGHAIAHFRKRWETASRKFSGEEREQMKFVREGSEWLISSEQEVKVFWIRKR